MAFRWVVLSNYEKRDIHMTSAPLYKRVLLKLSGEALLGEGETFGICPQKLQTLAGEVANIRALGVEVAIVIGAGNLFRGRTLCASGLNHITADQMGMLGTVMNAFALRDTFSQVNIPSHLMSAISMSGLAQPYNRQDAIRLLSAGDVVLFAGGTGNPLVTTDAAASLRSIEIQANILLKATQVDGVYTADPKKDPSAKLLKKLSYQEVIRAEYAVMELVAFTQCRDHAMPIRVFNIWKKGALLNVLTSEAEGTLIS